MVDTAFAIPVWGWLRILLVFCHVILCAFALTAVLKADLKILFTEFRREDIERDAKQLSCLLLGLWLTGLGIVYLDTGFSVEILNSKAKLLLKLMCVLMLTLNGFVLHHISFPLLTRRSKRITYSESVLLSTTGALSTSHWLLAAFIGISAPLSKLSFVDLAEAYAMLLVLVLIVSLMLTPVIIKIRKSFLGRSRMRQKFDSSLLLCSVSLEPSNSMEKIVNKLSTKGVKGLRV